ncbi:ABC transporter ATP-binding protein [Barrientosiimonas endolithica]|uniref:Lipoprotein-releasing system ATP-binding protein LolD n=1 Tax=Barrientosiimonas endolithica TaxID=1535208 RepID=A0ABM8HEU1_9MICO|nr:ABC transporter ATP-binding protein [Barrientosiimonas endolithica]BDZ59515.1 lipoprotein-releasing system ATP-binding protein LolD [Barrientosiimonas endolithica]
MEVDRPAPSPSVTAEGLGVVLGRRQVFQGLSFSLSPGTIMAVTGASGSGKSTLVSILVGLLRPTSGDLHLFGKDAGGLSSREWQELRRRRIGVVFQSGELLPDLTPCDNVLIASLLSGASIDDAREDAHQRLADFGVPLDVTTTAQLSGGEQQRVALARGLVSDPQLLLADEPTAALDRKNRRSIADLLVSQAHDSGKAVLAVTHDEELADRADTTLVLGPS